MKLSIVDAKHYLPLRAAWYIRFSASPISESVKFPCKQKNIKQYESRIHYQLPIKQYKIHSTPLLSISNHCIVKTQYSVK